VPVDPKPPSPRLSFAALFDFLQLKALERASWNVSRLAYATRILLENHLRREDAEAVGP